MSHSVPTRLREWLPIGDQREWFLTLGGIGVCLLVGVGLLGPLLAPYPATERVAQPLQPPGESHLLGTDDVGHDLFSLLLVGARVSLLIGLLSGTIAILIGIVVGTAAGLLDDPWETIIMRVVDVVLTLPFLPLVIVAAAVLGPSLWTTIGVLASVMWARPARELRSQVLSVRQREYVQASRAMGGSLPQVARKYVIPAVVPIVIAQFAKAVGAAVLLEASLSFLGLGDPTAPSWGTILFFAQNRSAFLTDAWTWWVLPPGLAITASVLSFTFLALGVERNTGTDRRSVAATVDGPALDVTEADDGRDGAVITVSDLTVEYGDEDPTVAVDDVDLTIHDDEVVGIVGESGSGKSSLALSLLGLLRPPGHVTDGRVTYRTDESTGTSDLAELRGDEIAFVPQEAMNALNPRVRLHDQVVEAIRTHRACPPAAAAEEAHEILETVGLPGASHERYPHELSGGMRQRGVIAIALVNDPDVLVVDEPTTGLDVVTRDAVLDRLDELQAERDLALVMVSHDLSAVTRIADRLAVMRDGAFVETGATGRLQSAPEHPYTERLLDAQVDIPTRATGRAASGSGSGASKVQSPGGMVADKRARSDPEPRLAYQAVTRAYGDETVLDGVDMSIDPGQSVALIGESGAGKSTLGRMAVGLDTPDQGDVQVRGEPVRELQRTDRRRLARRVHYLFQDPYGSLPPNRSVHQIVREPLDIHEHEADSSRAERVRAALRDVGLTPAGAYADRYPPSLSGGERQRVALARAVVLEPSVLVADEPTSMLDAPLRRDILSLLYELATEHDIALLHITHDVAQACSFADRLAVLHEGQIVETAHPASILDDPEHPQTQRLVDAALRVTDAPLPETPDLADQ
jgi:ABC-type glutathione transport system ATPase component/ABC-type dipeptide/oligopeptide/nickel transport system permease subunit